MAQISAAEGGWQRCAVHVMAAFQAGMTQQTRAGVWHGRKAVVMEIALGLCISVANIAAGSFAAAPLLGEASELCHVPDVRLKSAHAALLGVWAAEGKSLTADGKGDTLMRHGRELPPV